MSRIIAGEKKGLTLVQPKGELTRPTGDRAKEALFSILMPYLPEASFLDLFSGSGQIGLEALSRGAAFSVFNEKSARVRALLRENIERADYKSKTRVIAGLATDAAALLVAEKAQFDLIYADPPWPLFERQVKALEKYLATILKETGLFILEGPKTLDTAPFVTGLEHFRRCRYGGAMLFFYTKQKVNHA